MKNRCSTCKKRQQQREVAVESVIGCWHHHQVAHTMDASAASFRMYSHRNQSPQALSMCRDNPALLSQESEAAPTRQQTVSLAVFHCELPCFIHRRSHLFPHQEHFQCYSTHFLFHFTCFLCHFDPASKSFPSLRTIFRLFTASRV
ncbi:hypothetical protein E2C01_023016 [Portunus trituberculatus]|uniref:Uncharacterized protein n=1 Tax=Portunus trituberculatus TaxID=210409 RepID=A0A5B7E7P9_PORTR|nr:hypothetical protein [Portunus trituberculatus]